MQKPILEISNLSVFFATGGVNRVALRGINISLGEKEVYALVGASGSGKSVLLKSILRLLPKNAVVDGSIYFKGIDLISLKESELNKVRGKDITIVFQEPMIALNPTMIVGEQIAEVLKFHSDFSASAIKSKVLDILKDVGFKEPKKVYNLYPHQLSGGMRQRILIAMALVSDPLILLLDEPTTALDVTLQMGILELIESKIKERELSAIFVTHDFSVVSKISDRVGVIYQGVIVEEASVDLILRDPIHPYTKALIDVIPSLKKGKFNLKIDVNSIGYNGKGCPCVSFCGIRDGKCFSELPELLDYGHRKVRCFFPEVLDA